MGGVEGSGSAEGINRNVVGNIEGRVSDRTDDATLPRGHARRSSKTSECGLDRTEAGASELELYWFATYTLRASVTRPARKCLVSKQTHLKNPLRLVRIVVLILVTHPIILMLVSLRARRRRREVPTQQLLRRGPACLWRRARVPRQGARARARARLVDVAAIRSRRREEEGEKMDKRRRGRTHPLDPPLLSPSEVPDGGRNTRTDDDDGGEGGNSTVGRGNKNTRCGSGRTTWARTRC